MQIAAALRLPTAKDIHRDVKPRTFLSPRRQNQSARLWPGKCSRRSIRMQLTHCADEPLPFSALCLIGTGTMRGEKTDARTDIWPWALCCMKWLRAAALPRGAQHAFADAILHSPSAPAPERCHPRNWNASSSSVWIGSGESLSIATELVWTEAA